MQRLIHIDATGTRHHSQHSYQGNRPVAYIKQVTDALQPLFIDISDIDSDTPKSTEGDGPGPSANDYSR